MEVGSIFAHIQSDVATTSPPEHEHVAEHRYRRILSELQPGLRAEQQLRQGPAHFVGTDAREQATPKNLVGVIVTLQVHLRSPLYDFLVSESVILLPFYHLLGLCYL